MRHLWHSAVGLMALFGLPACEAASGVASATAPALSTATVVTELTTVVTPTEPPKTPSPAPTITALPTQVPFRSLARPILLYGFPVDESGEYGYQFEDAVGHRGSLSGLVTAWPTLALADALSPDGQWLAFESRHSDQPGSDYLGLYNLFDGATAVRLPLISDSVAVDLPSVSADLAERYGPGGLPVALDLQVFERCVGHVSWSSDSRYVAYTSQAPGPSPDVFVYDTQAATARRITKDSGIACSVEWSPDGAWLMYTTIVPGIDRPLVEFHRARFDALEASESEALLDGYWWVGLEWLGPDSFVVIGTSDGGPYHDLQVLDLQAGTATNLWPEPFEAVAVDSNSGLMVVSTAEPDSTTGDGLFLVSPGEEAQRLADRVYWSIWAWGQPDRAFVANDGATLVSISANGQLAPLFDLPKRWESVTRFSITPNRTSMAVFNEGGEGLIIVGADGQELQKLDAARPTAVIWRPDTLGLAYIEDYTLFGVDLRTGNQSTIYSCENASSRCILDSDNVTWIP